MFEFISLFLKKFMNESTNFMSVATPCMSELLGELVPTTIRALPSAATLCSVFKLGADGCIEDNYLKISSALGTSSTGVATHTIGYAAYDATLEELKTTQAYIESLNEEELSEMIAKLELKDVELSMEEKEPHKVKTL